MISKSGSDITLAAYYYHLSVRDNTIALIRERLYVSLSIITNTTYQYYLSLLLCPSSDQPQPFTSGTPGAAAENGWSCSTAHTVGLTAICTQAALSSVKQVRINLCEGRNSVVSQTLLPLDYHHSLSPWD